MVRVSRCCAVTLSWALSARAGAAQTLTGRVLDATDSLTVSGAEIRVDGDRALRSDGQGRYTIRVESGRRAIRVRLLGYAATADSVDVQANETITHDFYLVRIPRLLTTMVVKGHSVRVPSGFEDVYKRGATGAGSFVTRERIDSINPRDVAGLLHEVPFVHVNTRDGVRNPISTSRCRGMLSGSAPGGNMVRVFLNGASVSNPSSVTEILRHMAPSLIQAVEVYNGPTTVPFVFQPACAVIAIWTRRS